ncbi:glycosyltransferase family 2 protein [Paenibacillus cremeus]|uniref:Glycosyltransferase family 2 protein n=1 Tax=Paenibacillus cremeus TaxID=2163881 RepID=A0A559KIQ3_9BACL|nr:glycosyltransferase [Paenibacillus cremeus]TVY12023.1 glycosyltransferase family 2 protein [Paenibacillus cremeus]
MVVGQKGTNTPIPGISVIICTNKPSFARVLFNNYGRQRWANKELIVVVNSDTADLSRYKQLAVKFKAARVYRLPSKYTLGACLNFASARARHSYIARMDDDEYYAPNYLLDMMRAFKSSGADVVGKRAYFIHLSGKHLLIQRFYAQNQFVSVLAGGTLTYKKKVWRRVKFANRSLGEDVQFCRTCRKKGFKLYAGDRYNFCALRRKQTNSHTWKKTDKEFLSHPQTRIIARGDNYKKYVVRE